MEQTFNVVPMTFKSGNVGFGYYGKVEVNGKTYQTSVNMTEIKPKSAEQKQADKEIRSMLKGYTPAQLKALLGRK